MQKTKTRRREARNVEICSFDGSPAHFRRPVVKWPTVCTKGNEQLDLTSDLISFPDSTRIGSFTWMMTCSDTAPGAVAWNCDAIIMVPMFITTISAGCNLVRSLFTQTFGLLANLYFTFACFRLVARPQRQTFNLNVSLLWLIGKMLTPIRFMSTVTFFIDPICTNSGIGREHVVHLTDRFPEYLTVTTRLIELACLT